MTTRIEKCFAALKAEGRAAFVTFLMAGDPDHDTSLAIVKALPAAGADVIELGMPFTDPMADGPAIQAAGVRALAAGQTMQQTLALVRAFRVADDATPIVLMGYYNPIYIYGVERFLNDAQAAGVDGLIVVDLPPEEDEELCLPTLRAGLNFVRLATPTTDDERLPAVPLSLAGNAVPLDIPDARYYVDGDNDRVSALATQAYMRAKASGLLKPVNGKPPVRTFLAMSGGGDDGAGRRDQVRCGRLRRVRGHSALTAATLTTAALPFAAEHLHLLADNAKL